MKTVAIVDYGMSNLGSVVKALEHVAEGRWRVRVCTTPAEIKLADRVVFPGQGAIGDCMKNLKRSGLDEALQAVIHRKLYLGICLGLQALMQESEEDGGTTGLGLFPGRVIRFPAGVTDPDTGARLKVPHMGWNQVKPRIHHPLWQGIEANTRFYFVHSYYVKPINDNIIAATTRYAVEFTSALASDSVFAVQFHPEKSQHAGLRLLANFLSWEP